MVKYNSGAENYYEPGISLQKVQQPDNNFAADNPGRFLIAIKLNLIFTDTRYEFLLRC